MTMTQRVGASLAAAALVVSVSMGAIAAQSQTPDQPRKEQARPGASMVEGELLNVDADARTLTIKPDQGENIVVRYNDQTEVRGADKGVAGLAANTGTRVHIRFSGEGKDRLATHIEIRPRA